MDLATYQTLTGIVVPSQRQAIVTAMITRTRRILEDMLGFTLDPTIAHANEYTESGKTQSDCPCPEVAPTLDPADAVVTAYRLFKYYPGDKYISIDPATTINAVKLVNGTITYKTLETSEYRVQVDRGITKYLEQIRCWISCTDCEYVQLAVDADWLWNDENNIPTDLKYVWADMVTYYSDPKKDVRSETLGPHSYSKYDRESPEYQAQNISIIKRYAGPHGSVRKTVTI